MRPPSQPTAWLRPSGGGYGVGVDQERARELLARQRRRLEGALAELERQDGGDELSHLDQHPADAGTEMFESERDAGLAESLREELAAVERAERRLEEGTYGLSVESGQPIDDARLEAIPWAERTTEEQARFDHGR